MCGLRASAPPAVRGSGVSSRFPLSRGSSSCNLAARCHRLSLLASPFCSRRLVIASALPLASVPASCVLVLSLIVLLPVLAISRAGRSLLACLVRCGSRFLRLVLPLSRVPCVCLLRELFSLVPVVVSLIIVSCGRSSLASCSVPLVSSCLVAPCSSCLPVLRQVWAGSVSARYLLACPCFRRAGGWRCRLDSVGGAGLLLACLGWLAGDAVLSAVVVSGLWCPCLYI